MELRKYIDPEVFDGVMNILPWASEKDVAALVQCAEAGNVAGQYILGVALQSGNRANVDKAELWFLRAAVQGYAPAIRRLAGNEDGYPELSISFLDPQS